ncbi:extracellular solute-binding protein [Actinokineospora soli]|uniref:Extracellular solute-binding protein n=1 Tax=Actinokineospora soli TaxID=1048753 RepID=A0ABW2TMV4_9PSEU
MQAVDWLKAQFCEARTVVPGAVTMETRQAHPMFESGKGGIYFTGPYNMARFDKNLGKDKYEVVPAPPGPDGKQAALAEGENVYLMAGSRNEAGQLEFAEFAISAKGQEIGMAGDTEGNIVRLPVNTTVKLGEVRTDARWQVFDEVYRNAGRYAPTVPDWTPFRQSTSEALNGIVANCQSDTKAELDKLAATFTEELRRQGSRRDDGRAARGHHPDAACPVTAARAEAAQARGGVAVPGARAGAVHGVQVHPDGARHPNELPRRPPLPG